MGLAAILINEPQPFEQIFKPPSTEGSTWNLKKTGPGVSEKKLFKCVNGGMDDGQTMDSKWSQ